MINYLNLSDNELVKLSKDGDDEARNILITRYDESCKIKARKALKGVDQAEYLGIEIDDIIQAARIGANKAIDSFDESRDILFPTYASTCMNNNIRDLFRNVRSDKNHAFNTSESLDEMKEKYERDIFPSHEESPESIVEGEMLGEDLVKKFREILSDNEFEILKLLVDGYGIQEISVKKALPYKSVDNTMQRIRRKLKANL